MAETDTASSILHGPPLEDSLMDVNNRIITALNNARTQAKGDFSILLDHFNEELCVNGSIGRTKIEDWAETLGPKKIHLPAQKTTKYAGIRYRLWLQARSFFPILNPTMKVNGIYIGSDKLGHFLQQGLQYYSIAKSESTKKAEEWGTSTELEGFGLDATGVKSHADLEANKQGLKFYQDLEANQNLAFDLRKYINTKWNERINPNHYEQSVGKYVWTNILNSRSWNGTIKENGHSSSVNVKLQVSDDVNFSGEFTYSRKVGGTGYGKITKGKIEYLVTYENAIRGVKLTFKWEVSGMDTVTRTSKIINEGSAKLESLKEEILLGNWGLASKETGLGEWRISK